MAQVVFTKNLERHVSCPTVTAEGRTVREVLDAVFEQNRQVRHYVLDEQGALRKHMVIFIDGQQIEDRKALSDPVSATAEIYVMQALSGGSK
jgi:hypothetical protein